MAASDTVFLIWNLPTFINIALEVFLTGVLIALIGAAGYTFFIYSMRNDRAEKIAQRYSNPWDKVSGQDDNKPQHPRVSKSTLIGLLLLVAASLVLILLILLISQK